jgi:hypothetical protein
MRTARFWVVAAVAVLLSVTLSAQDKPGDVAIVYSAKPKPGSIMQLDAAIKKHFGWHREKKDTFSWFVWQVASGENMGDFVAGTFGHHWKELDARAAFDEADDADFIANVLPSIDKVDVGYWAYLPDASHPSTSAVPAAMTQVTHYFVKPEGYMVFQDSLKEIRAAMNKANDPTYLNWYRLVSGGEGPQFVLAVDRNSWADMEPRAKSLDQTLADVLGPQKAVALLNAIRANTRYTRSYMLRYRSDLSYVPAK